MKHKELLDKYNDLLFGFIGEMQMHIKDMVDSDAAKVNSCIHQFDVDVRTLLQNYEQRYRGKSNE